MSNSLRLGSHVGGSNAGYVLGGGTDSGGLWGAVEWRRKMGMMEDDCGSQGL